MRSLDYGVLRDAVAGKHVAIRGRFVLQPAEGPGAKVFPPTFSDAIRVPATFRWPDGNRASADVRTRYAIEYRVVNGELKPCVLLDSVQSQANRMEEALRTAWQQDGLRIPMIYLDLRNDRDLFSYGRVTVLDAPHRIADAIFRDCLLNGQPFRDSPPGKAFARSSPQDATGLYLWCPTALIFGVWDSTGEMGGLGAKFARSVVSEIVGVGAQLGAKVASRIDPLRIEKVDIYLADEAHQQRIGTPWTVKPEEAKKEKGEPVKYQRKGKREKGTPAVINHGNVAPQIDEEAGGVTLEYALHTWVLSLAGLRRLFFPQRLDGRPHTDRARAELAARTALAALALVALCRMRESGYALRSRCLLCPTDELQLELLRTSDGQVEGPYTLSTESAHGLLDQALEEAAGVGMNWERNRPDDAPLEIALELTPAFRDLLSQNLVKIRQEGFEG